MAKMLYVLHGKRSFDELLSRPQYGTSSKLHDMRDASCYARMKFESLFKSPVIDLDLRQPTPKPLRPPIGC